MLAIAPADAHAITMVVIFSFALGSLVTMFLIMIHNGKRNQDAMDLLTPDEEETADEKPAKPARTTQERQRDDWEKDEDWWKK